MINLHGIKSSVSVIWGIQVQMYASAEADLLAVVEGWSGKVAEDKQGLVFMVQL